MTKIKIAGPKPDKMSFSCRCGKHTCTVTGDFAFCGLCHCGDCRAARLLPVHHGLVFKDEQVSTTDGKSLKSFELSEKRTAFHCAACNTLMYNTNAIPGLLVVSGQNFLDQNQRLPSYLAPQAHIHYGERIMDVPDYLPKFMDVPESFGGSGKMFPSEGAKNKNVLLAAGVAVAAAAAFAFGLKI